MSAVAIDYGTVTVMHRLLIVHKNSPSSGRISLARPKAMPSNLVSNQVSDADGKEDQCVSILSNF